MIRGKKAGVQWPIVALFFLIAVALLITNNSLITVTNDIGTSQYQLLHQTEDAATMNVYIDKVARLSALLTRQAFLTSSGVYQQLSETGDIMPSACGKYLYPNYNSKTIDCTPKYSEAIKNYFDDFFYTYLRQYIGTAPLYFLYNLNVFPSSPQELTLQAAGERLSLPFSSTDKTSTTTTLTCADSFLIKKQYPKTALGFFTKEKPIICSSGECFAQVANLLYETYKAQNKEYAYVVNGESPYCPQDVRMLSGLTTSTTDTKTTTSSSSITNPTDPFFSTVTIPEDRFNQRAVMAPGFDSAGWLWWVGKHASVPFFDKRLGEAQYFNAALHQKPLCVNNECTLAFLLTHAQPGDVLFLRDKQKVLEDGSLVSDGGIYLALYIKTDATTGKPLVIRADPTKGLIKEFLPESYASGEDTKIAAIFRPTYQATGVSSLPKDLQIIPPFIGPFEWCNDQTTSHISQQYINQLNVQPFKSPQSSYYDLIIDKASESGVDPALLATHMVLESSMGQNNKCINQQKSALTGCGWSSSCAAGCGCEGPEVLSDEGQVMCTTKTDLGAYKEALDGVDTVVGKYEECLAYKNTPEIFWNCIFCIYQGSYDHVIGTGKLYFTKDKTCDYAERAKKTYCSWRTYFDENWNDLSALSSLHIASKLTFTPAFSATTKLDLPAMNLIPQEFLPSLKSCDDNLETCVIEKINSFNNKHSSDVLISRLKLDNAFANDMVEQVLDCRFNEQKNCVCPIVPHYQGFGEANQNMTFFSNGTFIADGNLIYEFPFNPAIATSKLSLPPSAVVLELEGNDKAKLYIDDAGKGTKGPAKNAWTIVPSSETTSAQEGKSVLAFGLLKQTYSSMTWIPYEQNITHLTCKDNKHYFSFQAKILSTGDVLNFSVYLDDTTPPQIQSVLPFTTGTCFQTPSFNPEQFDPSTIFTNPLGNPSSTNNELLDVVDDSVDILGLANTITMSWTTPANKEPLYSFIIEISQDPLFASSSTNEREVLVATALELAPEKTEPPILEQLTVHPGTPQANSINTYYFKTNAESFQGKPYEKNIIYYYRITPVDAFGNKGTPTKTASFTFTDPYTSSLPLSQKEIELLKAGTQITKKGVSNMICLYNQNNDITIDSLLPTTTNNLKVYPGLANPNKPKEPLYQITNIPNIICNETQTAVGKVCAGTEKLVSALHDLAPELEQKKWTMTITQAYRTWDIQYKLWQLSGFDRSMTCDPKTKDDPYLCPHMSAGAIDIEIRNAAGNKISPIEQEAFMCKHGFVRYGKEWWHFEMGTTKWLAAENARSSGLCCYYGAPHPGDTRPQTCNI